MTFAQPTYEPWDVKRVHITDPDLISFITENQMIYEDSLITSINILDLTLNGFGENDLLITNPMQKPYILTFIPDSLQSVMKRWHSVRQEQLNLDASMTSEQTRQIVKEGGEENLLIARMLESILNVLEASYTADPVRLSFYRDSVSATISLWGYEDSAVDLRSLQNVASTDTVQRFDIIYISNTDTLYQTDTLRYDLLYFYQTVQESLFIPPPLPLESKE